MALYATTIDGEVPPRYVEAYRGGKGFETPLTVFEVSATPLERYRPLRFLEVGGEGTWGCWRGLRGETGRRIRVQPGPGAYV